MQCQREHRKIRRTIQLSLAAYGPQGPGSQRPRPGRFGHAKTLRRSMCGDLSKEHQSRASTGAVLSLTKGSAHAVCRATSAQRVRSCLRDSMIVLNAASAYADPSHDLAIEPERDAAWECDQTTIGDLDVVQRATRLG